MSDEPEKELTIIFDGMLVSVGAMLENHQQEIDGFRKQILILETRIDSLCNRCDVMEDHR